MTCPTKATTTTSITKGAHPKRNVGKKKSVGLSSSLATLWKLATIKKKQYLHSDNTTEKYNGYVTWGKEWLASFSMEEQEAESKWKATPGGLSAEGENEIDENTMEDPDFCHAFEGCPMKCTPQAIAMFLAWKCFVEDNGEATADGIHAAFLAEYNGM